MPQGVIMRPEKYRTSRLVRWFEKMRILTWERVAQALGNPSRITVFRKLAQLEVRSCYSHRGHYHTRDRVRTETKTARGAFRAVDFFRHGALQTPTALLAEHP